jgi:hypothetical protein
MSTIFFFKFLISDFGAATMITRPGRQNKPTYATACVLFVLFVYDFERPLVELYVTVLKTTAVVSSAAVWVGA